MPTVTVTDTAVDIRFTGFERPFTGRGEVVVPLTGITEATAVDDALRAARGTRKGLGFTGVAKIGTWGLIRGPRMLVAAHRGTPGLLLRLAPGTLPDHDAILVSHPDAPGLAERIRSAAVTA
ncbi:hypothetical protein Afil01_06970 [Actinorhabdospora filicis]|uniref:Uncharacterized protein n=1 Tax=Actinorhabdospora filicis TaxID=1785913 RepID=A0A9W6W8Q1_9ACTN|nr:hypothetical protein [Actinorhabdospora filicis]GLZ75890.1 hypothetical protein Afil01_06970 [Actinorhabdospora filicis]